MTDLFQDISSQYHDWLRSCGAIVSPKISIADMRGTNQGRGILATEDIDKDEVLCAIPRVMLFLLCNCSLIYDFPSVTPMLHTLGAWESLILALLYEIYVKKNTSSWFPYLRVLPVGEHKTVELNQLVYWSDDELKQLEPSLILERVGKDTIASEFAKICAVISQQPELTDLSDITIDNYQDVASLIMAYSFDVPIYERLRRPQENDFTDGTRYEEDEGEHNGLVPMSEEELTGAEFDLLGFFKAMVPLADTLNADTKLNNAQLFHNDEMLVMKSIQRIKKGSQVYNTYADHPNSEILRRYGYVEYLGSKHDFGEIPARIIKDHFMNKSGMSSDLYDELMHILLLVLDVSSATDGAVEEIVLESYDCFITSEVIMEFVFVIQILTILSAIHLLEPISNLSSDAKSALVDRVYNKCLQLIEGVKLTIDFQENYAQILTQRMNEYPALAREPLDSPTNPSRKVEAETVLKCEYKSLENCLQLDRVLRADNMGYTFIDDGKLIRNILRIRSSNGSLPLKKKVRSA